VPRHKANKINKKKKNPKSFASRNNSKAKAKIKHKIILLKINIHVSADKINIAQRNKNNTKKLNS